MLWLYESVEGLQTYKSYPISPNKIAKQISTAIKKIFDPTPYQDNIQNKENKQI